MEDVRVTSPQSWYTICPCAHHNLTLFIEKVSRKMQRNVHMMEHTTYFGSHESGFNTLEVETPRFFQ